jgi:hypothetical protein
MLKKAILLGLALMLAVPVATQAQDVRPTTAELGPFPVDMTRTSPEYDKGLARYARITTTSYGFLKLTGNARSAGMGDAYSAVGNDLSAVFYNPAGVTQMERYAVTASYLKWIVGSQMGTFAIGAKTNLATIAINFAYFTSEEFEETTSSQPSGTGRMVTLGDMAAGVTIAKQVTDKLSVGGNLRWVQEDLDLQSYSSIDLDFGTLFYTGYRSTRLGMSLRNLGGDKDVIGQKARFPMVFNLSGAAEVYGNLGDPFSLTVAVEQMFFTDSVNRYHFGAEAWVQNMVALRGGYKTGYDSESWSLGAGLKQMLGEQTVKVDFSYSKAEALDEYPIRLSVGLAF